MLDLVDFGGGNVGSVKRCLERLEIPFQEVGKERLPEGRHPLVLPGVGAFGAVVEALREGGVADRVSGLVGEGTPLLGICVGLQILLESSEESPEVPGLGLIPGKVVRFQAGKVPQIGWNRIEAQGREPGYVYFVNSYYAVPEREQDVWYKAHYGVEFCAAVRDVGGGRHLTAFQFHPEKSGQFGHDLIKTWYEEVR